MNKEEKPGTNGRLAVHKHEKNPAEAGTSCEYENAVGYHTPPLRTSIVPMLQKEVGGGCKCRSHLIPETPP